MSTASITQQQRVVPSPPLRFRTNPWQRMLALLALVPAVIGTAFLIAVTFNHAADAARIIELAAGLYALGVAAAFALLWLVVAAINWQIKESARVRA